MLEYGIQAIWHFYSKIKCLQVAVPVARAKMAADGPINIGCSSSDEENDPKEDVIKVCTHCYSR